MAGPVCNLHFLTPSCFGVNESSPGQADGSIFVSALDGSSLATVKYNIGSDFTYSSGGQTSGNFTGLVAGTYTIYARNSSTCRDVIEITVGLNSLYSVRYRLEFHDLKSFPQLGSNRKYRLDILDNEYSGSVNELEGGTSDPVILDWSSSSSAENPFDLTVIGSELTLIINSRTDEEYIDLYTTDERRFKAVLYVYESGYQIYWSGFLTPMLYSEAYVSKRNYDINLTFTDGLADLSKEAFSDDSGNQIVTRISILQGISYIVKKTGLELHIWDSVNLYASVMDSGANDSTLEQGYFDPMVYLNDDGTSKDCLTVLTALMDFLGAKIYQANGKWNIDLISEKTASSVPTRKFNHALNTLSGGDEEPRILLRIAGAVPPKVTLADQSGMMSIPQTYGRIELTYDLGIEKENNLLDYGNFEDEDIENGQFKGWQADLTTGGGATVGLEKLIEPRGTSEYAFIADFTGCTSIASNFIYLASLPVEFTRVSGTSQRIKFSFDVFTRPLFSDVEIYIDYKITLNGIYVMPRNEFGKNYRALNGAPGLADGLIDSEYLRTFINQSLNWQTIVLEFVVDADTIDSISTDGDLQIEFRLSSNPVYDHVDITSLKTEVTNIASTAYFNKKRRVQTPGGVYNYELEHRTDAESLPYFVRPNDYNAGINTRVWVLKGITIIDTSVDKNFLQNILIDNVRMGYFPDNEDPVEKIVITEVPSSNIKPVYEKTLLHGDFSQSDLDDNYRFISRAYISESDGTPIYGEWQRRGVTENYSITQLLGKMIRGHYQEKRRKLSGSLDCPDIMPTFWNTLHEVRTGKIFQFMSLRIYLKNNLAEFQAIETLSGGDPLDEGADPGGDVGEVEPPVETRVHTSAFSSAFN